MGKAKVCRDAQRAAVTGQHIAQAGIAIDGQGKGLRFGHGRFLKVGCGTVQGLVISLLHPAGNLPPAQLS